MKTNTASVAAEGSQFGFLVSQAASLVGEPSTKMVFVAKLGPLGIDALLPSNPAK